MLTTSELLELQDSTQGKNPTQIIPLLISPKTSKLDVPGIEVNPIKVSDSYESKNAKISKGLSFKHPDDNGIWFKIRNATNISHLIKIFDNRTVWKQQCTFPCHTVAACYCKNVIIVSLIDNTLNFIDSRTGCPCLPSILMQGYTKYLQRVDEDKIALITNKNQLIIYEIDANTIPKCLLKVYFYGNLDDIRYVELTKELKTKNISPIIQTETSRYRYSIQRQCWTLPEYEYKSPFVKPTDNFESLDSVIKNFGYSLLTHDQALMEKTYLIMLNETPYECAIRLIEYSNAGIKEISGIELKDVLTHAFEYIQNNYSSIVDRIAESKQYALYLSEIKRAEEAERNKQKDESNSTETNAESINSNAQTIENSDMNSSLNMSISDPNISISGVNPPNSPSCSIQNSNSSISVTESDLPRSLKSSKSMTKQQLITREVPKVESEEIEKRNSFNKDLYSPIHETPDLFYRFDTKYEDYVEHSQKKDPKIEKYIEAFTYSSKEQKEIAKKLKLRLPKRRSKSTENEKKNDEDQKNKKKTKKRFIKPEIIQKKSSQQSRTAQQQPLLLTSFFPNSIKPMQSMQQIQQMQQMQQMKQVQQIQQVQQVQQIPQNISSLNLQQVQNPQQQTQQKNANHINWLMNELKNPKQLEIFSNAITNSQWDQIMRIQQAQQFSQNQQNPVDPIFQQILQKFKCSPAQARAQQKKMQQQNSTQMQQQQSQSLSQPQQQQNQNPQQQSQPLPQQQQQQLQQQQNQTSQQIQMQQQTQSPQQQTQIQQSPQKIQMQQQIPMQQQTQSPQQLTRTQQLLQQIQMQQQTQIQQSPQKIQMLQQTQSPQQQTQIQQSPQKIQMQQMLQQTQSPQQQTQTQQSPQKIQMLQQTQSPQQQTRMQQSPSKNQMQQMQQQLQMQQQTQSPQQQIQMQQPQQQIHMQPPQPQIQILQSQVQTAQPQSQSQQNEKPKRKRQTKKKNESSEISQNSDNSQSNSSVQINASQPIPSNTLNQFQNLTPQQMSSNLQEIFQQQMRQFQTAQKKK